jgi:VWFA-related protein
VFVDTLVRDKRTGGVVADLKQENFEVLDEGRPRPLSYFSREGDADRKPLALVLALDLRPDGAGRFLRRADIIEAMTKELARLPARDEVAILVLDWTANTKHEWLTKFTSDRAQTAAALARVPSLIAQMSKAEAANSKSTSSAENASPDTLNELIADLETLDGSSDVVSKSRTIGKDGETILRTEYKNGETLVRSVYPNGRVRTVRTSKRGNLTADMEGIGMPLFSASAEAVRVKERERPTSRTAIVWVSDGLDPVFHLEQRDATALLLRRDAIFNALVANMKIGFKLFKPVLKPLGNFVGMSIYNSAAHLARETGGVGVPVRRPEDYARGLGRIVGDLAGRYSLGFALAEDEPVDGRLRRLEVHVNARDTKGKRRKLEVAARRGYFVSEAKQGAHAR